MLGCLLIAILTAGAVGQGQTIPELRQRPDVYRVGGGVSLPQLVSKVEPEYPEEARKDGVQGAVILSLVVEANGTLTNITVKRSLGIWKSIDEAAVNAVRQWKFKPGMKNGKAVPVYITVEVLIRPR